ncbi:transcription factor VOZ1 [Amborella trichopoda]|uniref:Transcription factor VOZ1 n=1 Tax=Amborella trichopoda TaxID=13333 RepID=W1Q0P1_AMBTC|nr:transcription factor VOZ1 [Amborella trichopoda]XP_011626289.1 transcription factor VOZ1 [Amborella trichopoda]ERN14021.1 hypothetical protein AMTR_s00021p00196860 [Amborella trichopoda]|eukprot:XP_011626288.1 transcription factor VOZ1 [Amborella trichopoda]
MGKGLKNGVSKSSSQRVFKDKAKTKVDDLQGMFNDLQCARKESRPNDVAVLEEQVHQMLREWKAELNEASPTSSLLAGSLGSSELSSDMRRLLQLHEEDDDATSALAPPASPKLHCDAHNIQAQDAEFHDDFYTNQASQQQAFHEINGREGIHSEDLTNNLNDGLEGSILLEDYQFSLYQDFTNNLCLGFGMTSREGDNLLCSIPNPPLGMCPPPPSAFLGPKCALWDCPRPAQGSEWCRDYCSDLHATMALNEGPPGMTPVLRPGGIDLKDGPLFSALCARTQGKAVGIPECEGAATTKSPWNAPELFDLSVLEGESIREWLFFDKPRRAFESGNRKQRSLPDYCGRGWHESRKQVMKDFGGLKRSYYMDPQPLTQFEWHLYEYEINNCDTYALYRLELKQVDGKKNAKGKNMGDSLVDLQQQMGRLTSEYPADSKRNVKGRAKLVQKVKAKNGYSTPNQTNPNDNFDYGTGPQYGYFVDDLNDYYGI